MNSKYESKFFFQDINTTSMQLPLYTIFCGLLSLGPWKAQAENSILQKCGQFLSVKTKSETYNSPLNLVTTLPFLKISIVAGQVIIAPEGCLTSCDIFHFPTICFIFTFFGDTKSNAFPNLIQLGRWIAFNKHNELIEINFFVRCAFWFWRIYFVFIAWECKILIVHIVSMV